LQIRQDDELSTSICLKCLKEVQLAEKFKADVIGAQRVHQELLTSNELLEKDNQVKFKILLVKLEV
jgi:hypothetical protein